MTTHVFVVNSTTFKVHLEKMFAGTGAKDYKIDFNNSPNTKLKPKSEGILVGMTADASRIRKGDKILFYLQQDTTRHDEFNLCEGKFFGVFRAKHDWCFLDNNDEKQYLKNELKKSLTFRIEIEPDIVYPVGITEWEALDEIKNVPHPYQMIWSLIYRKLRGNRGNTMITIYESQKLIQLLRDKNERKTLDNSKPLSFDFEKQEIVHSDISKKYEGRKEEINVLPRLMAKANKNRSFEVHLQSYIAKIIGKSINLSLDKCFIDSNTQINWIGNEMGCGVGMQAIDLVLDLTTNGQRSIVPIELKSVVLPNSICNQIKRYVDWIVQYYKPNIICDISPAIICLKHSPRGDGKFKRNIEKLKTFNRQYRQICAPIKLIEFEIKENEIYFEEIKYD